jgi:hypothetical protein
MVVLLDMQKEFLTCAAGAARTYMLRLSRKKVRIAKKEIRRGTYSDLRLTDFTARQQVGWIFKVDEVVGGTRSCKLERRLALLALLSGRGGAVVLPAGLVAGLVAPEGEVAGEEDAISVLTDVDEVAVVAYVALRYLTISSTVHKQCTVDSYLSGVVGRYRRDA